MKYKLLSVKRKDTDARNIGDYIQALASSQFLPQIDGFINREELKSYNEEESAVIMNGWYMHNTKEWPPSPLIRPLFVAFHLNTTVRDEMLTEEGIEYLKKYSPIGCRDFFTRDLLINKGIEAYFSGCMTLTLGLKYKSKEKDNVCYVVDPIIPSSHSIPLILGDVLFLILNLFDTNKVAKKMGLAGSVKERLKVSRFLRLYAKYFEKRDLVDAVYVSQQNENYGIGMKDDSHRLKAAEDLVKKYARAKFVITKRIHCALPCLGLETPVVFLEKQDNEAISSCRFGGLIDLLNVVKVSDRDIKPQFDLHNKISKDHPLNNKTTWREYSDRLIQTCNTFINNER